MLAGSHFMLSCLSVVIIIYGGSGNVTAAVTLCVYVYVCCLFVYLCAGITSDAATPLMIPQQPLRRLLPSQPLNCLLEIPFIPSAATPNPKVKQSVLSHHLQTSSSELIPTDATAEDKR